jgi:rRNA maturation RNase YbeY
MTELQKWQKIAQNELKKILKLCIEDSEIKRTGPKTKYPWDVGVKICGLRAMRNANKTFRNKDEPTDVLSFPSQAFFFAKGFLGDLLICLPILKKQAKAQRHSEKTELRVLLIHGVLHLLGFDHEKGVKAAQKMQRAEKRILGKTAGLIERATSR